VGNETEFRYKIDQKARLMIRRRRTSHTFSQVARKAKNAVWDTNLVGKNLGGDQGRVYTMNLQTTGIK